MNGGNAVRAPGDVPCGGLIGRHEIMTLLQHRLPRHYTKPPIECEKNIIAIHRVIEHIIHNEIRILREEDQGLQNFTQYRIKYIVGEITKEQFAANIFRNKRKAQKQIELLHIYELIGAVGIDFFTTLMGCNLKDDAFKVFAEEQIEQLNNLRLHCNGLFSIISNTYSQTVPQINDKWIIKSDKFTSKTMMTEDETDAISVASNAESIPTPTLADPPVDVSAV
jgi:hypothetical protein